ncbi:MAG: UbiA family prenyltransferase [Terracidiphilus sp.]
MPESHVSLLDRIRVHIAIARPDHSIKNIFVLPGIVVALSMTGGPFTGEMARNILLGFLATTLIACSNYVINEVLDAPFDRLHPVKQLRPVARGIVNIPLAYLQWIAMMVLGIATSWQISIQFTAVAAVLWIMGCIYNIRPFRTKDVAYLDVVTESINNPLRMLLGWYMVAPSLIPPVSLLCCYWMLGCYFMALKRFSEFREIGNAGVAGAYRNSFKRYTERSLLESVSFYASFAMLLFGAFITRYRLELILSFPFVALMMTTYFDLAFKPNSSVQHPEKLYREPVLMTELILTCAVITSLLFIHIPLLARMFTPTVPLASH